VGGPVGDFELLLCHGTVCVVGKIRDLILQLSKSSIYSTKPHTADNGFVQPDIPLVLTYWGANRAVMFSPSGDTGDIFIFVTEDSLSHGVYDVSRQAAISLTKEDANTAAVIYKTAQDTLNFDCKLGTEQ
ncbi:hypothetical protein JR893_04020, partial [Klebsiella pneumoniae]|nr:hypothetical protein [Klebsiella pneumoniae]